MPNRCAWTNEESDRVKEIVVDMPDRLAMHPKPTTFYVLPEYEQRLRRFISPVGAIRLEILAFNSHSRHGVADSSCDATLRVARSRRGANGHRLGRVPIPNTGNSQIARVRKLDCACAIDRLIAIVIGVGIAATA